MPWTMSAPRVMIRQLRELMAKPEDSQAKLNRIVKLIAANMVAEVSSIYIRHLDGSLELIATEGLKQEAVHKTRLARGEGLVGLIAERGQPINLSEAQKHPAFAYRPETGEERFHSFLGVPVLRGGRTLGVLTLQNAIERRYTDEEVEALQTTAMVLAEMLASGQLANGNVAPVDPRRALTQTLQGVTLSDGIALGHVVFHEPRVSITRLIAEDPAVERARLEAALEKLKASIDKMLQSDAARQSDHRDIIEVYRLFAQDQGWRRRLQEAIGAGLTAEAAVERVQVDMRMKIKHQADPFMIDRLHDLDDLANRLLRILAGKPETAAADDLPRDTILVARNMGAAELLDYDRERLRGLVIEEGGQASHVAIVARALGIAAVGQAKDVLSYLEHGDPAVVDAETGRVYIRPSLEVVKAFADKARYRSKRQQQYERLRDVIPVTRDGQRINLLMNAGLVVDLPQLGQSGADGIGLFRTELQFMIASAYPKLAEQAETYRQVLDAAGDKPVVFRSLDVGGDKILPYLRHEKEENPSLGWRAIRMSLDRPGLFRTQIRALMLAAAGRELRVMLPFITEIAECRTARAFIDKELERLRRLGHTPPARVLVGAMIEVPAILWQLDQLLREVDFISVGSNDLMQFFFAADRENPRVSGRFCPLSAPALRMLRGIVLEAERHKKPLTLCGEMAGRPLEAMALIGIGFRSISMAPASLGPVKSMVLSLNARHLQGVLLPMIDSGAPDIRSELVAYANENNITITPFGPPQPDAAKGNTAAGGSG